MKWNALPVGLFVLLFSQTLFAYIPPSEYILKRWVNKHSGVKTVRVKSVVIPFEEGKPTTLRFKETSVFHADSQVLKSWITDEHERKLFYMEKKLSTAGPLARLLLSGNLSEVVTTLRNLEIPIRTESELLALRTEAERRSIENEALLRWNGIFAWVIGVSPSVESKLSQVWFEKDTFLPLRLVYRAQEKVNEFRIEGYRYSREYPFPRILQWIRTEAERSQSNHPDIKMQSELLEISVDSEKGQISSGPVGFTELGQGTSSAFKENVQKYYDSFR